MGRRVTGIQSPCTSPRPKRLKWQDQEHLPGHVGHDSRKILRAAMHRPPDKAYKAEPQHKYARENASCDPLPSATWVHGWIWYRAHVGGSRTGMNYFTGKASTLPMTMAFDPPR